MPIKRVAILGAGGMGTALAILFDRQGKATRLWARSTEQAVAISSSRENAPWLAFLLSLFGIGLLAIVLERPALSVAR